MRCINFNVNDLSTAPHQLPLPASQVGSGVLERKSRPEAALKSGRNTSGGNRWHSPLLPKTVNARLRAGPRQPVQRSRRRKLPVRGYNGPLPARPTHRQLGAVSRGVRAYGQHRGIPGGIPPCGSRAGVSPMVHPFAQDVSFSGNSEKGPSTGVGLLLRRDNLSL